MDQFIKTLDNIFVKKAPFQLPDGAKEWLVKYGPWITLVLIVLLLPVILLALGVSAFVVPFVATADPRVTAGLGFAWVFSLATLGLQVTALPGLFARKKSGWTLLLYATLINAVYNLLTFQWGSLIIGTVVSLYILMQIRSKYS